MAYLIPDFRNLTGFCMDDQDRSDLGAGCTTIVDQTMADLALDVKPPAPLASLQPGAISIGSVSKTFWAGLRVGWIRADRKLIHKLAQARAGYDLGTSVLKQLACGPRCPAQSVQL